MKLKALLLACAVAGAFASFALADDGHHGKHHEHGTTTTATTTGATTTNVTTTTPANCARVELRGTLASVSPTSFTLTITKVKDDNDDNDDNGSGSANPAVGSTVTIAVDAKTRVQWQGSGTLIGPNVGDSARVKALSCGSPATFTAQRVNANGPRAGHHEHQHESKNHK
jgi:hypothetical protein